MKNEWKDERKIETVEEVLENYITGHTSWMEKHFDKRQQAEIRFSRTYAVDFSHGTDGHNAKLIIAKMAALLDEVALILNKVPLPDTATDTELVKSAISVLEWVIIPKGKQQ